MLVFPTGKDHHPFLPKKRQNTKDFTLKAEATMTHLREAIESSLGLHRRKRGVRWEGKGGVGGIPSWWAN